MMFYISLAYFLIENLEWISVKSKVNLITSSGYLGEEGRAKRGLFSVND